MNRFTRNLSVVLFAGTLAVPIAIRANSPLSLQTERQDKDAKERAEKQKDADKAEKKLRVFDAKHNDYHDWNENEDRAYRRYLNERHEDYRDYGKMTHEKQTEYWEWRHANPDRDDTNRDRDRDDMNRDRDTR